MAKPKTFNPSNFTHFALINPISGSWGFVSYSDGDHTYEAIRGLNPQSGQPIPFSVFFSVRDRVYRCGNAQDVQVIVDGVTKTPMKMKVADYLRNHPNCEGSKANLETGEPAIFKEMDEKKDAGMHLSRIKRRTDAVNTALAMTPEQLDEIAPVIGTFNDDPDVKQRAVVMFAEQDPESFFSFVEKKDETPVRALIRKAIRMNTLRNMGSAIFWDKETLGGTEDQAVAYLLANKDKLDALKMAVKKTK